MSEQDINYNLVINEKGVLMTKNDNAHASFKEVVGIRPAFNLRDDNQRYEFFGKISDKNYCDAIMFTFKY